jgi:hypothetical protein
VSTAAQLIANQANASLSTGPLTAAGKAASSANATKHGLSSGFRILSTEDPSEYDALLGRLLNEMQPTTEHESFLVSLMAQSRWKLARIGRLEDDLFEKMLNGEEVTRQLDLMRRYSAAAERSYYKAHKELTDGRRTELKTKSEALDQYIRQTVFAPMPGQKPIPITTKPAKPSAAAALGNLALRL